MAPRTATVPPAVGAGRRRGTGKAVLVACSLLAGPVRADDHQWQRNDRSLKGLLAEGFSIVAVDDTDVLVPGEGQVSRNVVRNYYLQKGSDLVRCFEYTTSVIQPRGARDEGRRSLGCATLVEPSASGPAPGGGSPAR